MKPQVTKIVPNLREALSGVAAGVAPLTARCSSAFRHFGVAPLLLGELAGGYRACLLRTRCNVSRKLTPSATLRAEIVPPILAM